MDTFTSNPASSSTPSPAAARPTVSRLRLIAAGAAFAGVAATAGIGLAIAGGDTGTQVTQQAVPAGQDTQVDPGTQVAPVYPEGWDTTAQVQGGRDGGRHDHGTPPGGLAAPNQAGGPGHASTGGS